MLRLDKKDPLDRMLLQELEGNPVLFDTWLDAMDELAEEPDCGQLLRERGLNAQTVLAEAEAYRAGFLSRLEARNLPVRSRFELCAGLFSQAVREPSPALRRIYCEILADPGFLLDAPPKLADAGDRADYEEQVVWQYLHFGQERDALLGVLAQRQALAERFAAVTKENRNPCHTDCDTTRCDEIISRLVNLFGLFPKENGTILRNNLASYMQLAAGAPGLKSVEPLLLFRLLTKHQSRMCSAPDLNVSLPALWKPDQQQVNRNNGRNFKQFRLNLRLFRELCRIYETDAQVNLPLCWYGLDQVTALGSFYREQISAGWEDVDAPSAYPFLPTVEELVEDALFSCFEDGDAANVCLREAEISEREFLEFQVNGGPLADRGLERISAYMNERVADLAVQAAKAGPEQIKALCRDILTQAGVRPNSFPQIACFLAAVNSGLMMCQDWLAGYLLAQAGHALLGEPTEISEWPG